MSKLKSIDLLDQLSELEASLNGFSFEELNANEAQELKKSFNRFKVHLNAQIFGSPFCSDADEIIKEKRSTKNYVAENKLIAHVSHEIRTPLNGIIGFTNLLKEDKLTSGQLKKVDAIQTASYTLMEIINEVLEYSKLTLGTEDFDRVDFNFHGLIKDVMFLCQTLIVNKSVLLKIEIAPSIPKILLGDPSRLSQVLLNLLGNALKFVDKGYIKLAVRLKEQQKDTYVLAFEVEDTGIGMSEEQLSFVFDRFKQGGKDTFQKYGGSGLGLSIVKEIIDKQGGTIKVKSSLGKGTTFEMVIPFKKGNIKNMPQNKPRTISNEKGKELLGGTKILVFEDNELNQHLIGEQLNKWDCKTFVTANAHEGLQLLKSEAIDIVLMDLKMPEMDGFEISKRIRALEDQDISKIPIIAFSADFTAQDKEQCYTSGINDFLLKPYTLNELMIKLLKRKKERNLTHASLELLQQKSIIVREGETVDLTHILEECYGEIAMLEELIRLFKQNIYEFIGAVKIGISNRNFEEVYLAAHKIKAGLSLMKTIDLKNLILGIEDSCKHKEMSKVEAFFNQFLVLYPAKEELIDLEFEKLKNR